MSHEKRDDLLIKMYETLNNEISRHITIVWQSISVVIGAFTLLSLAEKNLLNIDLAMGIIILLIIWLFDHLIDSGYWYNRNLVIIANIERQFLKPSDLNDIHSYFGSHRVKNTMLTHLRIQRNLGAVLGILIIGYHFYTRIIPGFYVEMNFSNFDFIRSIPYLIAVYGIFYIRKRYTYTNLKFSEFIANSPGKQIDTSSIRPSIGHPDQP